MLVSSAGAAVSAAAGASVASGSGVPPSPVPSPGFPPGVGRLELVPERGELGLEIVQGLLDVALRVLAGLLELITEVRHRLVDVVDLRGRVLRLLLGGGGLVFLVVQVGLQAQRPHD